MKHLKLVVGILLTTSVSFAQTDQINLQKYWKLRNDLREDFTKIGSQPGESLPARSLQPLDCVDNINYSNGKGAMNYGDGMIRQGYYLGLLATEYRLLKDAGEDVTGTLNELYFALVAINRCDLFAESSLDANYGITLPNNKNGFYLREDIPENFALNNWGNSNLRANCVSSPMYKTNNAAHIDDGIDDGLGLWAQANSYQNVPSMDQLSSLMLGFRLIHKLVDDEYVLPQGEPEGSGFNVVTETQHIVDRIMTYLVDHKWIMIDVNGWPVANQGGDCIGVSYPLFEAAKTITGHNYTTQAVRDIRAFTLADVQFCITGFGIDDNKTNHRNMVCSQLNPLEQNTADQLVNAVPAGPTNNQNISEYMTWVQNGAISLDPLGEVKNVWINDSYYDLLAWLNDHGIHFTANSYAEVLVANFAVASGVWPYQRLDQFINGTGNNELYLINSLLRNEMPVESQSYYKGLLNAMGNAGPFNLTTNLNGTEGLKKTAVNGWGSDLRWTQEDEREGSFGETGIFNGIDYMLYHNLYYLIFKDNLPTFNTNQDCLCETITPLTGTSYPGATDTDYINSRDRLNQKLTFINSCNENAFQPVNNNVTGTLNLQPYFSNYIGYKIFPAKFMTNDATIANTGIVNVQTLLKLCNGKTLTIQNGGKLDIQQSETQVGLFAKIDNSGTVTVRTGKKLTISGTLTLRSTGKLIIEDGATVIIDASTTALVEYYNGAQIIMNGPNSKLIVRGAIRTKDLANFNIIQNGATCGQVIIDSPIAALTSDNTNATFTFTGSGKNVPYITITKNNKLWMFNNMAKTLIFNNANVVFEQGATLRCDQGFSATNSKFTSTVDNVGIQFSEGSYFSATDLVNVPVLSDFTTENIGIMEGYNSTFTNTNSANLTTYLVKIIGRGFKFQGSNFLGNKSYCVYAQNQSIASSIESATIGYNGSLPTGSTLVGIYSYSGSELIIKSSTISNCYMGIDKRQGKLTLRCDKFELNKEINVQPREGCVLNMNSTHLGGYNTLYKTANNKNIYLYSAGFMDIGTGYNYIDYIANATITGGVSSYCSTCPVHDVSRNQWNTANTIPSSIGTIYTSVPGTTIAWTISPVALKQVCPLDGVPDPGPKSIGDKDALPTIYSHIENDSIPLDVAIYRASNYMSFYNDSTPDDLRAINRFNEIISSNLDKSDSAVNDWLWFTMSQMKTAHEAAFASGSLSAEDNQFQFDPATQKVVNAMMYMSDSVINPNNYVKQFYHELDKAQLLRLIGHTDISLEMLNELQYCGLDSAQQAQLNNWKTVYTNELAFETANVSTYDTTIVVDTSGYLNPSVVTNNYSFGAIINDMNNIMYPNCDFFHTKDLIKQRSTKNVNVFPNPGHDIVTIEINSDVDGAGTLSIGLADGRNVYSKSVDIISNSEFSVDVSNWNSGIYLVTVTFADGKQLTKRLAVK